MPTFRAALYIAAGAAQMPFRRVLLLGTISAVAWNVLLLGAGMAVGGNAEKLEALAKNYRLVAGILMGVIVLALGIRWLIKRRRATAAGPAQP